MQCKKRAEHLGVSLLDQLELQLIYESLEPNPEVEYRLSASAGQSCTGHVPGSSSPKKRKRAPTEQASLPDRTIPQRRRAVPTLEEPSSHGDSFEDQADYVPTDCGLVARAISRPRTPTLPAEPVAPASWPQCCTPANPCLRSRRAGRAIAKKYYAVRNGRKLGIYYDRRSAEVLRCFLQGLQEGICGRGLHEHAYCSGLLHY